MHVDKEERPAGFKERAALRRKRKPPADAPCARHTHTHIHTGTYLETKGQTPPYAHATQLQTGLGKQNGLAGTRATKLPVWSGISGRSSHTPSSPARERSAAARGKGSFPPPLC
jgi:hypothetical protein